ncbi:MAG: glycosyltransferase family 39 protein, partial [Planctomycetota bacterium]
FGKIGLNGRSYVWFPIGHVWLLVPFVAAGEVLQGLAPGVEATFRERVAPGGTFSHSYLRGHPVLIQGLISLLVPAGCAATSLLLLYLLARALGAGARDAAITTLAIGGATQFFALGRETLSDGPGLCCFLAASLVTVKAHVGTASRWVLLAGGAAAGASVLLRYQNAMLVLACGVAIALAARRRCRWTELLWFAAGGVPFAALLMAVDMARFGNPLDTGYPEADTWFDQPVWLGLTKLFFAAGRGILWCSPLLWLALPMTLRSRHTGQLRWLAWALFALPMLLFATARGWQGGECWGARYVTPGIVVLLAIVLPQARPWVVRPRIWWLLVGLGVLVNVTSVVAPTRGVIQLATQAVNANVARELAAGQLSPAAAKAIDAADLLSWHPRYSPLHVNWHYAWLSHTGGFEDAAEHPRDGSANTIEPLFGVAAVDAVQGLAPVRWEDRRGRHLWWRFWGDLLAVPCWLLLLLVLGLGVALSVVGWRSLARP